MTSFKMFAYIVSDDFATTRIVHVNKIEFYMEILFCFKREEEIDSI